MPWQARDTDTQQRLDVSQSAAAEFDKAKSDVHHLIAKEADLGVKHFKQLKFQPVIGNGVFEAEFAEKDDDIIFHFWPYNYRLKQKEGKPQLPKFPANAETLLKRALTTSFAENRIELTFDTDMGSYFVKALGYAKSLNPRHLAIEACKKFYQLSGGTP